MSRPTKYKPNLTIEPVDFKNFYPYQFESCMDAPSVMPAGSVESVPKAELIGFPTGRQTIVYRPCAYSSPKNFDVSAM